LLFTIKQSDFETVKNIMGISVIGHITEQAQGINLVTNTGTMIPITAQGWDALRRKE
jgi:thiamine-monophosphate kinase